MRAAPSAVSLHAFATRAATLAAALALLAFTPLISAPVAGQSLGEPARATQNWRDAALHLGATARVLIIGTRPEDEDNALIAWLSLGRHIETAYLSLTRGESGVNRAGSERQSSLAVVRTAELLAERERDGAHQYFTRAYDFGSTNVDSLVDASWPRDSLLHDVVAVVRAFRPLIIIAPPGDTAEHDATKRLTASLAAEAFAIAGDTARLPSIATARLPGWVVSRFFTEVDSARAKLASRVAAIDVGEFDRARGASYAELGAEIRRLQRSQPPPPAPAVGPLRRLLRLDSTRVAGDGAPVGAVTPGGSAGGASTFALFGSIDTTLARFGELPAPVRAELDSLRAQLDSVRVAAAAEGGDDVGIDEMEGTPAAPRRAGRAMLLAEQLARVARRTTDVRLSFACTDVAGVPACGGALGDLAVALNTIRERATPAMLGAAGIVVDGVAARELVAEGDSVAVRVSVYNGGPSPLVVRRIAATSGRMVRAPLHDSSATVFADSTAAWPATAYMLAPSYHWWQINGLLGGTYLHDFHTSARNSLVPQLISGEDRIIESRAEATFAIGGVEVPVIQRPLVYRGATTVRGDTRRPLAGVPAVSVLLERTDEYERSDIPLDRLFRVYLWSARSTPESLAVDLQPPPGITVDSATRTVVLPSFGTRNVFFRLHGRLSPGPDTVSALVRELTSPRDLAGAAFRVGNGSTFKLGVVTHEYPHIPTQQFVRFSKDRLQAVDLRVPPALHVAYVKGAHDLQPAFAQLHVGVQALDPGLLPIVDLSAFTTILVAGDAFADDNLAAAMPSLQQFLKKGGTVVVLGGTSGAAVARSGLLPYPIAFDSVVQVANPAAAVHVTEPRSPLLAWPNALDSTDFDDWVEERARQVPTSFDPRYRAPLTIENGKLGPAAATLLTARVGQGTIVFTTLTIDDQLDAVNPGAARLLVNLLAAGVRRAR